MAEIGDSDALHYSRAKKISDICTSISLASQAKQLSDFESVPVLLAKFFYNNILLTLTFPRIKKLIT